jgi:hypothetical protein
MGTDERLCTISRIQVISDTIKIPPFPVTAIRVLFDLELEKRLTRATIPKSVIEALKTINFRPFRSSTHLSQGPRTDLELLTG